MRALIFGRSGYLAAAFREGFRAKGSTALIAAANILDAKDVRNAIAMYAPEVVINAAGKTHSSTHTTIDGCQEDAEARSATYAVNVLGAAILRDVCASKSLPLLHLGSGCIFDGYGDTPLTEDAEPNPVSYYAETKVLGDATVASYANALILRLRLPVSDDHHPRNTLVKLAGYARVVDAPNSVTDVRSLVEAAWQLLNRGHRGIFNVVNPGVISPYDVVRSMGLEPERLLPAGLNSLTLAARSNCVLSSAKLEAAGVRLIPASVAIAHHVARLAEARAVA